MGRFQNRKKPVNIGLGRWDGKIALHGGGRGETSIREANN